MNANYNRKILMEFIVEHNENYNRHTYNAKNVLFNRCDGLGSCLDDHDGDQCAEENDGEECSCECDCGTPEVRATQATAFASLAQAAAQMAHTTALLMPFSD